ERSNEKGWVERSVGGDRVALEDEEVLLAGLERIGHTSAADRGGDDDDRQYPAEDVEDHLRHVDPDDGLDPADEGVDDRDQREHDDDDEVVRVDAEPVEDDLERDRGGEHADAAGEQTGEEEGHTRRRLRRL